MKIVNGRKRWLFSQNASSLDVRLVSEYAFDILKKYLKLYAPLVLSSDYETYFGITLTLSGEKKPGIKLTGLNY